MEEGVLLIGLLMLLFSGTIHLFQGWKNYHSLKENHQSSSSQPPITVIIAAHNEEKNLRNLIPALLKQDYPSFSITVILDRCIDESIVFLKSITDPRLTFYEVIALPLGWNGKKYALQKGISASKTDWLLLTDADCLPENEFWVQAMSKGMLEDKDLVLGVSPYLHSVGLLPAFIQLETLITASRYIANSLINMPYMGVGRNIAYRKSTFLKNGGFHNFERIVGGDDDLIVQRLATTTNTSAVFGENSLTYSIPQRTWKEYLRQKTRHLGVSKYYAPKYQRLHAFWFSVHITFWLSFLILVTFNLAVSIAFSIFVIFFLTKGLILKLTANRLGIKWSPGWIIMVDFIYVFGLPLWTLKSVLTKKIGWN